jgi:carbonic anhydrase
VTADEALQRLIGGNERYAGGRPEGPGRDERRRMEQADGQTPFAVILSCSDSRVPPEILFDQGIGDLFVIRVAGNTAADDVTLGSLEYGVNVIGCSLLLVLGHEKCGAVTAAVDAVVKDERPVGHLAALTDPILPAVEGQDLDAAVKENVRRQVRSLADMFTGVTVLGAEYGLRTGRVELLG